MVEEEGEGRREVDLIDDSGRRRVVVEDCFGVKEESREDLII
jgi:hypothetical protein